MKSYTFGIDVGGTTVQVAAFCRMEKLSGKCWAAVVKQK